MLTEELLWDGAHFAHIAEFNAQTRAKRNLEHHRRIARERRPRLGLFGKGPQWDR